MNSVIKESSLQPIREADALEYYSLYHYNKEVFERLREWRMEQSKKEGVPPYFVASDRVLRFLASCFTSRSFGITTTAWNRRT